MKLRNTLTCIIAIDAAVLVALTAFASGFGAAGEAVPRNTAEPDLLLVVGLAMTATGLLLRGSRNGFPRQARQLMSDASPPSAQS